jgi:predicted outer membrane repeat protein
MPSSTHSTLHPAGAIAGRRRRGLLLLGLLLSLFTRTPQSPDTAAASAWRGPAAAPMRATAAAQQYLKAANPESGDFFGRSVALDGDTLVVAAYGDDSAGSDPSDNSAADAGAASVFVRVGDTWTQQAYLKAANAASGDAFGQSVALDGDTIVVGAIGEDSSGSDPANNSAETAGAAYVFVRTGSTWTQQAYLKAANVASYDTFGAAVAIAGDTIVVGAVGEDSSGSDPSDNSAASAGAAYVFVRAGTTWTQQGYLKAANAGSNDNFGGAVAVSGETIVVGAVGEDSSGSDPGDNSAASAGAAYLFVRDESTWSQQGYLKATNAQAEDSFGLDVAITEDTIVVGASYEDSSGSDPSDNSAADAGAAYVFARSGSVWSQQAYLKASNGETFDEFGTAVAIDGATIVVGATGEASASSDPSDNSAEYAGAVYRFDRTGTTWMETGYFKAATAEADDQFGDAVALDTNQIVVGAFAEDSGSSDPSDNSAASAGAAYAVDATPIVCAATSSVSSAADAGPGSLREAIAQTCAGGTITFASDTTIHLASTLEITQGVTIAGGGQAIVISGDSDGDGDGDVRPFVISGGSGVTLDGLTIQDGLVTGRGHGGGILSSAALTVTGSLIRNNTATDNGGGIYGAGGLTVIDSTITGNQTTYAGGGIGGEYGFTIRSSTIADNLAGMIGGGVYGGGTGAVLISTSTIANNHTTGAGGGIAMFASTLTLEESTLMGNRADGTFEGDGSVRPGGAVLIELATATVTNSILADSDADSECAASENASIALSSTLIEDGSCGATLTGDPRLAALGAYGGPTQTAALRPGSPALDAGSACGASDQRGVARPQGAGCDLGAFESRGFALSLVSGSGQQTTTGSPFAAPLVVQLSALDSGVQVGAGHVITVTAPASGRSLSTTLLTATTDLSGTASLGVTANGLAGSYVVSATTPAVSQPVSFALQQQAARVRIFLPFIRR